MVVLVVVVGAAVVVEGVNLGKFSNCRLTGMVSLSMSSIL